MLNSWSWPRNCIPVQHTTSEGASEHTGQQVEESLSEDAVPVKQGSFSPSEGRFIGKLSGMVMTSLSLVPANLKALLLRKSRRQVPVECHTPPKS